MSYEELLRLHEERRSKALAMGGIEKLKKRKEQGKLDARERISLLFDQDSFIESGLFATSQFERDRDRTPADGKVAGFGKIDGRLTGTVANDFTVMGASSSPINSKKIAHIRDTANERGMPMVFLGESTGARMPDIMGAAGIGSKHNPTQYLRIRTSPWVSGVLGHCYGSSAWYACLSDFVVMRKDATMAISSAGLNSMAISENVRSEPPGGWKMHTSTTGLVDHAVDTDEEAIELIRRFLSYMPGHHGEDAPRGTPAPLGLKEDLNNILPEKRSQVYDMRRILDLIADPDSILEMKARFAKSVVTALARLDGHTIGVIANNPIFKGGALDVDACRKVTSFLVMCDSYNIPIVFLVDQPGFLVGTEGEARGAPGHAMNWMNALSLVSVPKFAVIIRKSYGLAFSNMGGGGNAHEVACWPSADVSFMDPEFGATIVYGVRPEDDPIKHREAVEKMRRGTSAYDLAAIYGAQAVIRPDETRLWLGRMLEVYRARPIHHMARHLMQAWPTSY